MIKLLHTADIHIGRQFIFLQEKAGDYRAQLVRTLEKIVDLALKEEVSLLLIAGDLFDNNRVYGSTIGRVMTAFQKLEKPGIRVCILPGLRDSLAQDSVYVSLQLPPNMTLLSSCQDRQIYPDLDLTVYGRIPGLPKNLAAEGKSLFRVGLAHCPFRNEGETGGKGQAISADEITGSGLDYLALGYHHSFREVSAGNTAACYCGSPEPLEPGQEGAGNVVMATLREGQRAEIQPVKIGTKRMESVLLDISGCSGEEILQQIEGRADPNLVLKVILTGLRGLELDPDCCRRIEKDLGGRFFKLLLENASSPDLTKLRSLEFPPKSVAGRFLKIAEEKIASAAGEEEKNVFEEALALGFSLLRSRLAAGKAGDNSKPFS
jgi:DNA repair protein SbcD/Mre11